MSEQTAEPGVAEKDEVKEEATEEAKEEEEKASEWPDLGVFEGMMAIDPKDIEAIKARCPQRFIDAEKGDVEKGKERWVDTINWRREMDMDNILRRPHPKYHIIKKYYPHWFHLRAKSGLPVYYERPSKIDLKALKAEGITMDDLLYHYRFITEFLWVYVQPHEPPEGKSITVLDIHGMGMKDAGGQVTEFIRAASGFTGAHYPERCSQIFILNAPWYFTGIFKMFKSFLDPVTVAKTCVCSSKEGTEKMLQFIDKANLPKLFGGECKIELGDSPESKMMDDLVNKLNSAASQ
jgi:hypothetical protein